MRKFIRSIFTYNTANQIIAEDLKINRLLIVRAHFNLEELECEVVKQRAEIEKLEARNKRLNGQWGNSL